MAVADSDETPPVDDTESVPVAGAPVLLIDKRVVGVDVAGDNVLNAVGDIIDYEIDVTNDGNVTLTNVTVTDPLTGGLLATFATLAPGVTETVAASYAITQADLDSNATLEPNDIAAGFIDNVAVADSDETPPVDDTESVPVAGAPVLLIDKRVVGVDVAGDNVLNAVGDIIDYEIDVTNDGNVTLTNVTVTDPLTGGLLATFATLAPGVTETVAASYAITQADLDSNATLEPNDIAAGFIDNVAVADSDETPRSTTPRAFRLRARRYC